MPSSEASCPFGNAGYGLAPYRRLIARVHFGHGYHRAGYVRGANPEHRVGNAEHCRIDLRFRARAGATPMPRKRRATFCMYACINSVVIHRLFSWTGSSFRNTRNTRCSIHANGPGPYRFADGVAVRFPARATPAGSSSCDIHHSRHIPGGIRLNIPTIYQTSARNHVSVSSGSSFRSPHGVHTLGQAGRLGLDTLAARRLNALVVAAASSSPSTWSISACANSGVPER